MRKVDRWPTYDTTIVASRIEARGRLDRSSVQRASGLKVSNRQPNESQARSASRGNRVLLRSVRSVFQAEHIRRHLSRRLDQVLVSIATVSNNQNASYRSLPNVRLSQIEQPPLWTLVFSVAKHHMVPSQHFRLQLLLGRDKRMVNALANQQPICCLRYWPADLLWQTRCPGAHNHLTCVAHNVLLAMTKSSRDCIYITNGPLDADMLIGDTIVAATNITIDWAWLSLSLLIWTLSVVSWLLTILQTR